MADRPVADDARPVVIVSNRGPVSFAFDDRGELVSRRGGGGLVTALGPAVAGTGALWIAAARSEAAREAARRGVEEARGYRLRSLVIDPDSYRAYYDVISNQTLWFLHHHLFDAPRQPRFDEHWRAAWHAYRQVNATFARAVTESAPEGATVLVQDYHLSLLAPELAAERPDLRPVHFNHTPFCSPDVLRMLPAAVATELLEGLAAHVACGFHAERWALAFEACCRQVLGGAPPTFVSPGAADAEGVAEVARSPECAAALADLEGRVGGRRLIVRVDRIELSKNLLRGFHAFDHLLGSRPEWRRRVVFGAFVYPSRATLPAYQAYRQEVEGIVARINQTWGTDDWTPILYDVADDFPSSVAALRRFDVLLVNPLRDGLNLVAKEGMLVNQRDGVLALSRESGVWGELGQAALELNPYDVAETAEVLHAALAMDAAARRRHADELRRRAAARTPRDWLGDQLRAGATVTASSRGRPAG